MSGADHLNSRVILAAVIALIGVIVGWRALSRSAPAPLTTTAAPTPPAEALKSDPYEIKPIAGAEHETAQRLTYSLRVALPADLAAAGVTRVHMDALADNAAARLALLLEGAPLERVADAASATGMQWTDPQLTPATYSRFEKWAQHWRQAPMSAERAIVRTFISGEQRGYTFPEAWQSIKLRNPLRPSSPDIPDGALVVELVVPALARAGDGMAPSIPASVGISYFWDPSAQQWTGGMFTIYAAEADTNRLIPPP